MLSSRRVFKNALHQCKINENKNSCHSILEKFAQRNKHEFWKEVKNKKFNQSSGSVVGGLTDPQGIAELFATKFLKSDNDMHNNNANLENELLQSIAGSWEERRKLHMKISKETLAKIILKLNKGMGPDGIHSSFLKSASDDFLINLSRFFNICFMHC